MLAAERVPGVSPGTRGGKLSEPKDHTLFSFALSETPPPVRSEEQTPLGDLDFDFGDFGDAEISQEKPRPLHLDHAADSARNSSAMSPAVVEVASSSLVASDSLMAQQSDSFGNELSGFDLTPIAKAAPEPGSIASAVPQPVPVANAQVGQIQPETSPKVKKIQFPSARRQVTNAPKTNRASQVHASSNTRFSKSVGASKVRAKLDSEPELADAGAEELQGAKGAEADLSSTLSLPEDLPEALERAPGEIGWNSETPTAREIWKSARKTWQMTSRQALAIGGQGLRAGRELARETNEKIRLRLSESEKEKQNPSTYESRGEIPPDGELRGGDETLRDAASITGRVILGLARSTGRRLAAPLSAVAAAALVYLGGTHFFGTPGTLALSKGAPAAEIPKLGTIETPSKKVGHQKKSEEQTLDDDEDSSELSTEVIPPPGKAPQMKTEVVEMPKGLSWPGKGLIEVVTSEEELIYVDGVFTGRGPLRRIPVSPGEHEVSIRSGGLQRTGVVQVTANRNTRAIFASH